MKHIVNQIEFKTDKALQEYAKGILYKDKVPSTLNEEDYLFMYDYFRQYHSGFGQKKGVGILKIWRLVEPNYGKHRAFGIERKDGSTTDISYILSNIKVKESSAKFKAALRRVIQSQIDDFRREAFRGVSFLICPITKEPTTYDTCHIDHESPTFDEIVKGFVDAYKLEDVEQYLAETVDNQTYHELDSSLASKILARQFYTYHFLMANLRVVSAKGNLTRKKK